MAKKETQLAFHAAQKEIAKDTHRFRIVCCGRRFGKTTLAVIEMLSMAVSRTSRICYIAPTYQQARDIAWDMLKKISEPVKIKSNEALLLLEVRNQEGEVSQIFLRGYEAVETLRGQRFDFLVLDEVASMRNFFLGWEEVLRPTLTDMQGHALFISTPKGFNHFYELYRKENDDEDYKSFRFSTYDNPFIPIEELEKARLEIPEDRFAQEYLADFRKTEGLVYKEFNRERHIVGDQVFDKKFVATMGGIDFGHTNPAAVLKIARDGDRNYYVLEEFYKTKQSTEQIAEAANSMRCDKYFPDPAEPDRVETLKKNGLNVHDVKKGHDSIELGVDKIRALLKADKLFIHKSCKHTIWEFETYHYPEGKPGINQKEKPHPENDHAMDALRYVILMDAPVEESVYNEDFSLYSHNYD